MNTQRFSDEIRFEVMIRGMYIDIIEFGFGFYTRDRHFTSREIRINNLYKRHIKI